jgi:hypothetical protein
VSSPCLAPSVVAARRRDLAPQQHLWETRVSCKSLLYSQNTAQYMTTSRLQTAVPVVRNGGRRMERQW